MQHQQRNNNVLISINTFVYSAEAHRLHRLELVVCCHAYIDPRICGVVGYRRRSCRWTKETVMNLDQYQRSAMTFRLPTADREYALLNLFAEAGEVAGKAAKHRRDGGDVEEYNMHIKKELGDVLWQVAAVAKDHGWMLSQVAEHNLEKLSSRQRRDVIQGSGDTR